jgi:polyhydroxyalkanoate synthesis regulator phasin
MAEPEQQKTGEALTKAYERMLDQVHESFAYAEEQTVPRLRQLLDEVRDKAVEWGELTREEAERVAGYLERDLQDAANYLAQTGDDLRAWLRFDLDQVEERLMEVFTSVADQTRLQWDRLAEQAWVASHYRSGEISGPGSLRCTSCGELLALPQPAEIPPCPECGGTLFERPAAGEAEDSTPGETS